MTGELQAPASSKPLRGVIALPTRRQLRLRIPSDASQQGLAGNNGEAVNPLRSIRRQSNMTQQDVAQRLGVSQRRISEIERADITSLQVGTLGRYLTAVGWVLHIVVAAE